MTAEFFAAFPKVGRINGVTDVIGTTTRLTKYTFDLDNTKFTADYDRAGIWPVERAYQVQESALPRARRPGEGDEVTGLQAQRNVGQRADPAVLEGLADTFEDDLDAAHRGRTQ